MIETTLSAADLRSPPTVPPAMPVTEAAEYLRRPEVSVLPVLDDGSVVGVVTASDLVAMVAETDGRPSVRTIMSSPVTTVPPETTVSEAAERMRTAGVKHLPVVDDEGYRGVLSVTDLSPYLPRHHLSIEWRDDPLSIESDGGRERPPDDRRADSIM
ncbi:CBS domain-containing protein [Haloplanus rallus]|jgi:CBS domain-containing protein|uniref:CBS domain-containing protein n=1 Tax=Haloplanus rallus TaxID=1816183 RepID=A0A6B9F9Y9_9EURY|nr:CBS domain-containing protein [Haloplanus rallus]QGX95091.1 CBS domain-containing protein [Haloplanus rallus]